MLQPIGQNIWPVPHHFTSMGMRIVTKRAFDSGPGAL